MAGSNSVIYEFVCLLFAANPNGVSYFTENVECDLVLAPKRV